PRASAGVITWADMVDAAHAHNMAMADFFMKTEMKRVDDMYLENERKAAANRDLPDMLVIPV
ncbi:MAG: hypothetical protein K2F82_03815, partial [Muribaculaceae bacterium]|nr:hypothetical protein [Muribaculaceae bacterium]